MSKVDDIISFARAELGKPYVWGAEGPDTFDCSGLMQYVFARAGVKLPRTADAQQKVVSPVASPLPGDLVFWDNPASHVALYIGDGKIIAAPQPGDVVKIQNVWGNVTYGRVSGIGTATAPILNAATQLVSKKRAQSTLSGVRLVVVEVAILALGVGLVWYGMKRMVSPVSKRMKDTISSQIDRMV